MIDFKTNICDYICSGHALLSVDTFEKDRAISQIVEVSKGIDRKIHIWSIANGWTNIDGTAACETKATAPIEEQLQAILNFEEKTICVLKDFGGYLRHETYPSYDVVVGWLDELRKIIASVSQTIIFVGPDFQSPKQLLHDITRIDFDLPDGEQIHERINFVCSDVVTKDGKKFQPDPEIIPQIVDACRGMTAQQIADRVALSLRRHKDLNEDAIRTIITEKAGVIRASGLLSYIEPPPGGLAVVGGYNALKRHVVLDKPCFSKEARAFGIDFPRGLMLAGPPGCGKTLISTAIASELNLPLVAMDVGNLMGSLVGESESNLREALKLIEGVSPCVLQLDEIEKGFGGSGDLDGGTSRRIFGAFLKWMNDRISPVYIIATANQVQSLPPEFCRKGRFDEIYGLDLPSDSERVDIFGIHLRKRNRNPESFDTKKLSKLTEGYTGADIEEVVRLSLKVAFSKKCELETSHLEACVSEIVPLSRTEANRIAEIQLWCKSHAKPANPPTKGAPKTNSRTVTLN